MTCAKCHLSLSSENPQHIEPYSGIKASESPEYRVVSAALNVPGLIWPTWKSMKQAEKGLVTVSAMETGRNNRNKKK
jgi:hypothetical protein